MKILSVDIGGSGFRKAIVCKGKPEPAVESGDIKSVGELLEFVRHDLPASLGGVAYSIPGVLRDGRVVVSPNRPFLNGVNLAHETTRKISRASVVCNDMEAAVMGMARLFPDQKFFTGITWSSGIGERTIKDRIILAESEVGHMQLETSPFAPICACGKRGCAEALFGGLALQRRIREVCELRGTEIPPEYKCPSMFLDASYDAKIPWAIEMYDSLSMGMARLLAATQSVLRVPAIVWKGAIARDVLKRKEGEIQTRMANMLIDPKWGFDLEFYHVWDVEPYKDADALIGAAEILEQII